MRLGLVFWLTVSAQQELNRDVDEYFGKFQKVGHCEAKIAGSSASISINEAGQIIHSRDLAKDAGSNKQMLMDMLLRGVVEQLKAENRWLPKTWISFWMVYTASGPHRKETCPVVCFGKREPSWQPGLLMPNPFFGSPSWWDATQEKQMAQSETRRWSNRSSKALFRGTCGPGALPRFELLRLRDETGHLDVGFTKVDGYKSMPECVNALALKKLQGLPEGSSSGKIATKGTEPTSLEVDPTKDGPDLQELKRSLQTDVDHVLRHRLPAHVPQSNFSQFRYLIHMPGSATGSYSRNLQYLWAHGSIVLIWDQSAVEHYYQYLVPGIHYLPINQSNVYDTLRHLEASPLLQRKLRTGARAFALTYISGTTLTSRWARVFDILRQRQHGSLRPSKESSCTCDPDLLRAQEFPACAKCLITKLQGTKLNKFLGITPKTSPKAPS